MAKEGDKWLSKGDKWLNWREMGGQVVSAPAFYDNSLGSNPDISLKYKLNDISQAVANAL